MFLSVSSTSFFKKFLLNILLVAGAIFYLQSSPAANNNQVPLFQKDPIPWWRSRLVEPGEPTARVDELVTFFNNVPNTQVSNYWDAALMQDKGCCIDRKKNGNGYLYSIKPGHEDEMILSVRYEDDAHSFQNWRSNSPRIKNPDYTRNDDNSNNPYLDKRYFLYPKGDLERKVTPIKSDILISFLNEKSATYEATNLKNFNDTYYDPEMMGKYGCIERTIANQHYVYKSKNNKQNQDIFSVTSSLVATQFQEWLQNNNPYFSGKSFIGWFPLAQAGEPTPTLADLAVFLTQKHGVVNDNPEDIFEDPLIIGNDKYIKLSKDSDGTIVYSVIKDPNVPVLALHNQLFAKQFQGWFSCYINPYFSDKRPAGWFSLAQAGEPTPTLADLAAFLTQKHGVVNNNSADIFDDPLIIGNDKYIKRSKDSDGTIVYSVIKDPNVPVLAVHNQSFAQQLQEWFSYYSNPYFSDKRPAGWFSLAQAGEPTPTLADLAVYLTQRHGVVNNNSADIFDDPLIIGNDKYIKLSKDSDGTIVYSVIKDPNVPVLAFHNQLFAQQFQGWFSCYINPYLSDKRPADWFSLAQAGEPTPTLADLAVFLTQRHGVVNNNSADIFDDPLIIGNDKYIKLSKDSDGTIVYSVIKRPNVPVLAVHDQLFAQQLQEWFSYYSNPYFSDKRPAGWFSLAQAGEPTPTLADLAVYLTQRHGVVNNNSADIFDDPLIIGNDKYIKLSKDSDGTIVYSVIKDPNVPVLAFHNQLFAQQFQGWFSCYINPYLSDKRPADWFSLAQAGEPTPTLADLAVFLTQRHGVVNDNPEDIFDDPLIIGNDKYIKLSKDSDGTIVYSVIKRPNVPVLAVHDQLFAQQLQEWFSYYSNPYFSDKRPAGWFSLAQAGEPTPTLADLAVYLTQRHGVVNNNSADIFDDPLIIGNDKYIKLSKDSDGTIVYSVIKDPNVPVLALHNQLFAQQFQEWFSYYSNPYFSDKRPAGWFSLAQAGEPTPTLADLAVYLTQRHGVVNNNSADIFDDPLIIGNDKYIKLSKDSDGTIVYSVIKDPNVPVLAVHDQLFAQQLQEWFSYYSNPYFSSKSFTGWFSLAQAGEPTPTLADLAVYLTQRHGVVNNNSADIFDDPLIIGNDKYIKRSKDSDGTIVYSVVKRPNIPVLAVHDQLFAQQLQEWFSYYSNPYFSDKRPAGWFSLAQAGEPTPTLADLAVYLTQRHGVVNNNSADIFDDPLIIGNDKYIKLSKDSDGTIVYSVIKDPNVPVLAVHDQLFAQQLQEWFSYYSNPYFSSKSFTGWFSLAHQAGEPTPTLADLAAFLTQKHGIVNDNPEDIFDDPLIIGNDKYIKRSKDSDGTIVYSVVKRPNIPVLAVHDQLFAQQLQEWFSYYSNPYFSDKRPAGWFSLAQAGEPTPTLADLAVYLTQRHGVVNNNSADIFDDPLIIGNDKYIKLSKDSDGTIVYSVIKDPNVPVLAFHNQLFAQQFQGWFSCYINPYLSDKRPADWFSLAQAGEPTPTLADLAVYLTQRHGVVNNNSADIFDDPLIIGNDKYIKLSKDSDGTIVYSVIKRPNVPVLAVHDQLFAQQLQEWFSYYSNPYFSDKRPAGWFSLAQAGEPTPTLADLAVYLTQRHGVVNNNSADIFDDPLIIGNDKYIKLSKDSDGTIVYSVIKDPNVPVLAFHNQLFAQQFQGWFSCYINPYLSDKRPADWFSLAQAGEPTPTLADLAVFLTQRHGVVNDNPEDIFDDPLIIGNDKYIKLSKDSDGTIVYSVIKRPNVPVLAVHDQLFAQQLQEWFSYYSNPYFSSKSFTGWFSLAHQAGEPTPTLADLAAFLTQKHGIVNDNPEDIFDDPLIIGNDKYIKLSKDSDGTIVYSVIKDPNVPVLALHNQLFAKQFQEWFSYYSNPYFSDKRPADWFPLAQAGEPTPTLADLAAFLTQKHGIVNDNPKVIFDDPLIIGNNKYIKLSKDSDGTIGYSVIKDPNVPVLAVHNQSFAQQFREWLLQPSKQEICNYLIAKLKNATEEKAQQNSLIEEIQNKYLTANQDLFKTLDNVIDFLIAKLPQCTTSNALSYLSLVELDQMGAPQKRVIDIPLFRYSNILRKTQYNWDPNNEYDRKHPQMSEREIPRPQVIAFQELRALPNNAQERISMPLAIEVGVVNADWSHAISAEPSDHPILQVSNTKYTISSIPRHPSSPKHENPPSDRFDVYLGVYQRHAFLIDEENGFKHCDYDFGAEVPIVDLPNQWADSPERKEAYLNQKDTLYQGWLDADPSIAEVPDSYKEEQIMHFSAILSDIYIIDIASNTKIYATPAQDFGMLYGDEVETTDDHLIAPSLKDKE